MSKIVIIGAGAMGSAFAVPCADNSNEVFLVGSFLEDKVINEIKHLNNFHPILKSQLPNNIKVLKFSEFNTILKRLEATLLQKFNINHFNIQPEFGNSDPKSIIIQD